MSADTSQLYELERSLRQIPSDIVPRLRGVVAKAAANTKAAMRKDAQRSRHFRQLAQAITYDLHVRDGGDDVKIEADVGPTPGGPGSLAGIAYFGSSKPGGGTVRNPEDAMLEEAPNFHAHALRATEGLL